MQNALGHRRRGEVAEPSRLGRADARPVAVADRQRLLVSFQCIAHVATFTQTIGVADRLRERGDMRDALERYEQALAVRDGDRARVGAAEARRLRDLAAASVP